MGAFVEYKETSKPLRSEHLHVDISRGTVSSSMTIFKFIDKDTKQHVFYLPALELSGYGDTVEKAKETLLFSMDNLFKHLVTLSVSEVHLELAKYGWKKTWFKKEFSKAYVDLNGELQNLNAENNKVERATLIAA